MSSPTSAEAPPDSVVLPPSSPIKVAEEKPVPQQCSRFSVSRFSITHVSDSDVDSMGGQSTHPFFFSSTYFFLCSHQTIEFFITVIRRGENESVVILPNILLKSK